MLAPTPPSKVHCAISFFSVVACFCFLLSAEPGLGQPPQAPAVADGEAAKPEVEKTEKAKAMGTRPAEPPPVIQQLNSAIEELASRISPAVCCGSSARRAIKKSTPSSCQLMATASNNARRTDRRT